MLAIGNAIVDILAYEDETFLTSNGLNKGTMSIVNDSAFKGIYAQIEPVNICSGGSAANSIVGIVSLGARGAFIGKVPSQCLLLICLFATKREITFTIIVPSKEFVGNRNKIEEIIQEINKKLTPIEKIKKFHLIEENFSIENGLLTPTMKIKRNKVTEKYKNILQNFYKNN